MLAVQVLRETVDDIFADLRGSFVCLAPTLAGLLIAALCTVAMVASAQSAGVASDEEPEAALWVFGAILALVLVVGVGWLWTAVAWHRMIVLGEAPGRVFPKWHGGNILGYLGRGMLVGLLVGLASAPLAGIALRIAPAAVGAGPEADLDGVNFVVGGSPTDFSVRGILVWLAMTGILYGLLLRLSVILPAGAVDRPLRLGEAWSLTAGRFASLFVPLGILLALVTLSMDLIAGLVSFGGVLELFSMGLQTLLGIGVLTRLYIFFVKPGPDARDNPLRHTETAAMPPE